MVALASVMAAGAPKLHYSSSHQRLLNPTKKLRSTIKFTIITSNRSLTRVEGPYPVRAASSEPEEPKSVNNTDAGLNFQDDFKYIWKLGAGSLVAAAVIKYGSIIFPEITRPNILLALIMVSTPVIVAVLLLFRQSRLNQQS